MIKEASPPIHSPQDQAIIARLRDFTGLAKNLSPESEDNFRKSDTVIISGQTLAAGKSAIIATLEAYGWRNKPSLTTRELRPGEVKGVDKIPVSFEEMLALAESGKLLEMQENRPNVFYATSADFEPGGKYIKDTELNGAFSLREIKKDAKIVVPLPPASFDEQAGVMTWEKRIIDRERLNVYWSDKKLTEIETRLMQAIPDLQRMDDEQLVEQDNTLVIINDDLSVTAAEVAYFLEHGKPLEQKRRDVADTISKLIAFLVESGVPDTRETSRTT